MNRILQRNQHSLLPRTGRWLSPTVLTLLAITGLLTACGGKHSSQRVDLQATYEATVVDVPLGSSEVDILAYLDERDILYEPREALGVYPQRRSVEPLRSLPEDTLVIRAQLDERVSGARWDVFFILDESHRLVQIVPIDYLPPGL